MGLHELVYILVKGIVHGDSTNTPRYPPKRVYFCRTNDHLEVFINHAEVSYGGN